jgi:hypothetical protein
MLITFYYNPKKGSVMDKTRERYRKYRVRVRELSRSSNIQIISYKINTRITRISLVNNINSRKVINLFTRLIGEAGYNLISVESQRDQLPFEGKVEQLQSKARPTEITSKSVLEQKIIESIKLPETWWIFKIS